MGYYEIGLLLLIQSGYVSGMCRPVSLPHAGSSLNCIRYDIFSRSLTMQLRRPPRHGTPRNFYGPKNYRHQRIVTNPACSQRTSLVSQTHIEQVQVQFQLLLLRLEWWVIHPNKVNMVCVSVTISQSFLAHGRAIMNWPS